MADFTFITARLATGAAINSQDDVSQLVAAGITAVLDCRSEFDDGILLSSHPALSYLWNGTADDGAVKSPDWFNRGFSFALPVLAKPKEKVYCHCAAGINRGPSMTYAIMRALGFSTQSAEGLIRLVRPQVGLRYKGDADTAIHVLGYD